jgi:hypothetical protein
MPSLHDVLQAAVGPAFQIGRELPGAGMSRVFLAREPGLARDVVVKVLPPDLVSSASLQRFTREVEVTARLQHPHILPVITAGGTDDLRYYVTPFIRGESLRARLAHGERMTVSESLRIADQLMNAIAFAHGHGVIHRDVKPGNILLSEGHAILADFGIAAIAEASHPLDHSDQVTGSTMDSTRIYVAPEQPRTEQRDLFAAAVVIHEMATGVPGRAGLSAATIAATLRARHPRASAMEARRFGTILARALAGAPEARYESAADFRAALHSIGRGTRRPLLAGVGVGGVAAVLTLSIFALRSPDADEPPALLQSSPAHPVAADTARGRAGTPVTLASSTSRRSRVMAPPLGMLDSATMLYRHGDLAGAGEMFQRALARDTANPRARLGLAITKGISDNPIDAEASRIAASRALDATGGLDAHDRAVAAGLIALADRRYPDACAAFDHAASERGSFEAWFGAGECRLRDEAVVIAADGTPVFRAGYATAFRAFSNAARAAAPYAPAVVYRRLMRAAPQTSTDLRMGRSADGRVFVGQWQKFGDSLGHSLAVTGAPRRISSDAFVATAAAAKAGREALRPLLLSWVDRAPDEPAAHEALALWLENSGVIAEEGDDHISALAAMARARELDRDPIDALRLAVTHARLMLRARQYEALADLADSVLAANPDESAVEAEPLMSLAILTGRIERAAGLLARISGKSGRQVRGADGRPVELPATMLRERADFLVRSSLGVCDDRVRSAPARLVGLLDAAFPGGVARGVESNFLERIVSFALPCLGPSGLATLNEPGRSLATWARAFDPADTAFAAEYEARVRARPPMNPGAEAGVDAVILDASVRLAIGDSVGALRQLTQALDRIPIVGRGLLSSEWSTGATVRGMAMAADIAAGIGEDETARRWSAAITALWRDADPELQPRVARLRAIAGATPGASRRE